MESEIKTEKDEFDQIEPQDTYHMAYIIHFLLGAGYVFPWNSFITAIDYFEYLYPRKQISKVFSVAYMVTSTTVLFVLMCWSSSGNTKLPGFRIRMNLGLGLFVLTLMVAPVTDWIDHGNEGTGGSVAAYVVLVCMVAMTGLADGLTSGSLIAATGELPGRYMQAVLAGNASSGVLVSLLRIITKASLPHSPKGLRKSTKIYFLTGTFVEFVCIVCCNLLERLPNIRYHKEKYHITRNTKTSELDDPTRTKPKVPKFWEVLKKIQWLVIANLIIFVVTLSIFPGYLSENVKSAYFQDWYPIILITTFNIGDFLGKCLTAVYVLKRSKWAIWNCVARLLFYPFFFGCVNGPKWLRSEALVVSLTLMLGISSGYLNSVLMILAPKSVPVEESEMVGITMSFFLVVGLAMGSAVGWLWNYI